MRVIVDALPDVLLRIPQPLQLHHRVSGEVGLNADERRVVVQPQAVDLPCEHILVELASQHRHLLSGSVVQHLRHKAVAAFSCSVSADDVRHALLRLLVDLDAAVPRVLPSDVRQRQPVIRVCEEAGAHRFLQLLQPSSDGLAVEYRLARHAPHAEAVDLIVIFVRLLKALQRPYGCRIQKTVVLVGALVHPRSFVPPVKKSFLQPVLNADRVEAQDDLLVLPRLSAQSDVKLVEVSLQQLASLFNPDARDVVDGFQLLNVIQSRKDDLAAVLERDGQV